jgi:hypothetical protein
MHQKRLCCQNLAHRQTEIKLSFFVEHLNSWFDGTHENHENWYTTNKNEFTVYEFITQSLFADLRFVSIYLWQNKPCNYTVYHGRL